MEGESTERASFWVFSSLFTVVPKRASVGVLDIAIIIFDVWCMLVGISQADIARGTVSSDSSSCAELRWWASGAVAGFIEAVRVIVIEFDSVRAIVTKPSEFVFGV